MEKTFYNTDRSSFFSEEIEIIRLPLPEGARSPNEEKQIPLMYKVLRQKKKKKKNTLDQKQWVLPGADEK